jgi:hypothetical protein
VVVEIIDIKEKIAAFLPLLDEMVKGGLFLLKKSGSYTMGRIAKGLDFGRAPPPRVVRRNIWHG